MRYWHPFTKEALIEVEKIKPTRILMIPLYPQFSTTTTGSSITELKKIAQQLNLTVPTNILCCYPFEQKFIAAHVELIKNTLKQLSSNNFRIIFSAHGLPQSIINKGDPYEWQINTTVEHIIKYGNFDSKK